MSPQTEDEGYEALELQVSDEVKAILEARHILDDEVKMVIYNGETTGQKLYQTESDKLLAKLRIANVTFYVKYSCAGERIYSVHSAYCHRTEL